MPLGAHEAGVGHPLGVAQPVGSPDDLVRDLEVSVDVTGRPRVRAYERMKERQRVVELARDPNRLLPEGLAPIGGRIVAQRRGQPREQPRP